MKVVFTKNHPSGIEKGAEHDFSEEHAQRLVNEGYAKAEGLKKESVKKTESTEEAEVIAEIENEEAESKGK